MCVGVTVVLNEVYVGLKLLHVYIPIWLQICINNWRRKIFYRIINAAIIRFILWVQGEVETCGCRPFFVHKLSGVWDCSYQTPQLGRENCCAVFALLVVKLTLHCGTDGFLIYLLLAFDLLQTHDTQSHDNRQMQRSVKYESDIIGRTPVRYLLLTWMKVWRIWRIVPGRPAFTYASFQHISSS